MTCFGGHIAASGELTLSLPAPPDPSVRGQPLHAQGAVLLDSGGLVLTNAAIRIVHD